MVGTTISHYKILEKIHQGRMEEVYSAEDTSLKREVPINRLSLNGKPNRGKPPRCNYELTHEKARPRTHLRQRSNLLTFSSH